MGLSNFFPWVCQTSSPPCPRMHTVSSTLTSRQSIPTVDTRCRSKDISSHSKQNILALNKAQEIHARGNEIWNSEITHVMAAMDVFSPEAAA